MNKVPREKIIENEIKAYIVNCGGVPYKIHGGDLYQESGIPDILACWGRIILWNRSQKTRRKTQRTSVSARTKN